MKLMSFTAPVLIVCLTAATVCGLGTLAVRASATSTRTSIELLRIQLRVTRLHEQILQHSRERLAAEVRQVSAPPAEDLARPWPEGTAGQ